VKFGQRENARENETGGEGGWGGGEGSVRERKRVGEERQEDTNLEHCTFKLIPHASKF
jgi:hypothetical protein